MPTLKIKIMFLNVGHKILRLFIFGIVDAHHSLLIRQRGVLALFQAGGGC